MLGACGGHGSAPRRAKSWPVAAAAPGRVECAAQFRRGRHGRAGCPGAAEATPGVLGGGGQKRNEGKCNGRDGEKGGPYHERFVAEGRA
jgi:hypothetical protein